MSFKPEAALVESVGERTLRVRREPLLGCVRGRAGLELDLDRIRPVRSPQSPDGVSIDSQPRRPLLIFPLRLERDPPVVAVTGRLVDLRVPQRLAGDTIHDARIPHAELADGGEIRTALGQDRLGRGLCRRCAGELPVGLALRVFLEVHSQSLDLQIGHHHAAAKQFEQLDAEAKLLDRHELRILRPFRVLETDVGGLHTRDQRLANVEIAADLELASRKVRHSRRDERLEPVEVEDCDDDHQRRDGAGQEDAYGDCDLAKHETTSAGPLAVRPHVGFEFFRSLATPPPAWRSVKSTLWPLFPVKWRSSTAQFAFRYRLRKSRTRS